MSGIESLCKHTTGQDYCRIWARLINGERLEISRVARGQTSQELLEPDERSIKTILTPVHTKRLADELNIKVDQLPTYLKDHYSGLEAYETISDLCDSLDIPFIIEKF